MNNQSVSDLPESVAALEEAELSFLLVELTKARDAFSETRPHLGAFYNSLLGILDDDRTHRPARANAERAELQRMFTGHTDLDDDGGFGWTGDRLKREG